MTNDQMKKQGNNSGHGTYTQTGFKPAKIQQTTKASYKDYCPKCGKLKSSHKFFQGCPK